MRSIGEMTHDQQRLIDEAVSRLNQYLRDHHGEKNGALDDIRMVIWALTRATVHWEAEASEVQELREELQIQRYRIIDKIVKDLFDNHYDTAASRVRAKKQHY